MPLKNIQHISYPDGDHEVASTAAHALTSRLGLPAPDRRDVPGPGVNVCMPEAWSLAPRAATDTSGPWMYARVQPGGTGLITASWPSLLYALVHLLADGLPARQEEQLADGLLLPASFAWNRPLYDTTLTQIARTARGFNPESYIESLARAGFTHLEVNGLAAPTAHEAGVPGEFYSQFYSYGPGIMQFVDSELTRGLYDVAYQQANLNRLKKMAAIGRRYGLKPGLLAYEPRTLPENFFQKYPTLRGARVDHPFRSRMPRYTLAQDHPVSRAHYRELIQNLMQEVPDLAYLSVWTNDSGSGFEHTASLYSGRNGGPYLIREWRNHDKIASAAGESAVRWLRLIQSSAAEINPAFEVSLRIEPFKVEHDTIVEGMGNGLTLEAPSLMVRGYHLPYQHPKLPENDSIAGTMFHTAMAPEETQHLDFYRSRQAEPIVQYAPCSTFNMEPLLGIPYPRMLAKKLQSLKATGIRRVSAIGGLLNPDKTPYWPHPEIIRAYQLNAEVSIDEVLQQCARRWAGELHAPALVAAWDHLEEALAHMPYLPLFSNFGFVWYRLWIRPFVPDIETIPQKERDYYERFMVTMPNNSNMNDLGKDVLFQLVDEASGRYMAKAFDQEVLPRFDTTLAFIDESLRHIGPAGAGDRARDVFGDLTVRVRAAKCWATTQRNLCTWVTNVYRYLDTDDSEEKAACTANLQRMIDLDLQNTAALLDLWEHSDTEFILVSDAGETSFIYGENFGAHLSRKISLTEAYRHHTPRIDSDIIWRID